MAAPPVFERLKERKLVQWTLAYGAGAFVVLQIMDALAEPLSLSTMAQRAVLTLVVVGFFIALVLAWYHGEKGRQRVSGPELLIVTLLLVVAGTGVWLMGEAEEMTEPATRIAESTESWRVTALDEDRPTIAVLPLANLSTNEANSYFAAGIHEELLRRLSLVRALAVISRTSVLKYAEGTMGIGEIAAELGARYIVEGSVQENDGRMRIQVQLIDASADRHIWAERYDRPREDIFELQSEVAQAIAGQLEAVVSPEEQERIETRPTQDPIAYDLFLRSRALGTSIRAESDTGVALLRRATRIDPEFALAHAQLAMRFFDGSSQHRYPPFDSAIARADLAVSLDPGLPEAQATKGWLLAQVQQFEAGRGSLQRALTLNPSSELAWSGLAAAGFWSGDHVGGALAGRQGARINPNGVSSRLYLGYSLSHVGMYDEAAQWLEQASEVGPNYAWILQGLLWNSVAAGDLRAARAYVVRMREVGADNPMVLYNAALWEIIDGDLEASESALSQLVLSTPTYHIFALPSVEVVLALILAQAGGPEGRDGLENLRSLRVEQVESGWSSNFLRTDLAAIASVLGDEDEQLRWFLEAIRMDQIGVLYVGRDLPWNDPIRDRPEFQSWIHESEQRMASQRRELAAMGVWTPEAGPGVSPGG